MPNSMIVRAVLEALPLAEACELHQRLLNGPLDQNTTDLLHRGLAKARAATK